MILCNSPELLCDLEDRSLGLTTIGGARPRGVDGSTDEVLKKDLFLSEKEQAEHIMFVTLERNNMGRLAKYGTVKVTCLMNCESYRNGGHSRGFYTGSMGWFNGNNDC